MAEPARSPGSAEDGPPQPSQALAFLLPREHGYEVSFFREISSNPLYLEHWTRAQAVVLLIQPNRLSVRRLGDENEPAAHIGDGVRGVLDQEPEDLLRRRPGPRILFPPELAEDPVWQRFWTRRGTAHVAVHRDKLVLTPLAPANGSDQPSDRKQPSRPLRLRRIASRARQVTQDVLLVLGALLLIEAGLTLWWQEPLTALVASERQRDLEDRLRGLERRPAPAARAGSARSARIELDERIRGLALAYRRELRPGSPLGRLAIPKLNERFVVVQGSGSEELRSGPGHYTHTSIPGEPGTVGIAGHRTTYSAPFRHIDRLNAGDELEFSTPYARFKYTVQGQRIVPPSAVGVLRPVTYARIVLTACHPPYSDEKRIVVSGRLTASRLRPDDRERVAGTSAPRTSAEP